MLGLGCCAWAFSSCGAWASCGDFSCCGAQALGCLGFSSCSLRAPACRFSSCGTMGLVAPWLWNLLEPGLKPVFLALQGRFLTTGPPGKPKVKVLFDHVPMFLPEASQSNQSLCLQLLEAAGILQLMAHFHLHSQQHPANSFLHCITDTDSCLSLFYNERSCDSTESTWKIQTILPF